MDSLRAPDGYLDPEKLRQWAMLRHSSRVPAVVVFHAPLGSLAIDRMAKKDPDAERWREPKDQTHG